MSSIHEQAMNYVYQQVLQRLTSYFSRAERTALQLFIQRLIVSAGGIERIGTYKVMVAFSGGKDSAYTVAFLRAAQLSIANRSPTTFSLRVATLRHAGMTSAVMDNIHRSYSALFLYDDPRVEVLMVDHQFVRTFNIESPFSSAGRERNRSDMLLTGHMTAGDGRATFCNSCYLGLADFFARAACWGTGIDSLVSGDSRKEQKQYMAWAMRLAEGLDLPASDWRNQSFNGVLKTVSGVGQAYYHELYGEGAEATGRTCAYPNKAVVPAFLTLFDLVSCNAEDHWPLLIEFLNFQFDDLSFNFSESDCANPMLMAHMRGLQAQYVNDRTYPEGVREYLILAKALMRGKKMPEQLIDQAMAAYDTLAKIEARRMLSAAHALDAFGLNDAQLVCLLFAPFVDSGLFLEAFLRRCHPGMLVALPDLHKALMGLPVPEHVTQWLIDISGLSKVGLQALYGKKRVDFNDPTSLIARVRAGDPDKRRIMTVDAETGEPSAQTVSGR
ncbi:MULTISPECIES: hypothetical protein [unclassified Pseudomonas]|uniref:hypothetical protein n=1 Tax=unclassified Pseudomonas TaxID=196821 RepID=UPI002ACB0C08|nr:MULTISPECIES: hypothetical protein [unclassified Pseudomonas]MEB0039233.1 hypothetical protein [Pseudomonas sp. MH10]MEB0092910.1 hypothetical protein [Pseudomonas sp. CCI4.2]MEB0119673.1 hypothetical protein [Pseudomonas sp. CCI1.2]WPX52752.1 hypothetical protein RHM65_18275 [Pseudomonas sp. CCI4.2]WPX64842.1 hypothetical protein RHM59_03875 [Pseudomonas sp. MH10]